MSLPAGQARSSHCYRHPDRQSFVLCQRCARTVCPACQTAAPVGVICPECMAQARAAMPRRRHPLATRLLASGAPVTYAIIGVTAVVYLAQFLLSLVLGGQDLVQYFLLFNSAFIAEADRYGFEPWRAFTVSLVHGGLLHLLFNMLSLWIFGRALEQVYGAWRFLVTWVVSVLGGSLAVVILSPEVSVVGASGGVFGLLGAYFTVMRKAQMQTRTLLILIGLNLAGGFLLPGISWQAHVGGLLAGLACGALMLQDVPRAARFGSFAWGGVVLGGVIFAATLLPVFGVA